MPRYYCDYCDTYLTHDSPSVRKQHNAGYKHKVTCRINQEEGGSGENLKKKTEERAESPPSGRYAFANVRIYYQQYEAQQNQYLIDQKVKEHLGQAAAYQQVGAAYNQLRPRLPVLPTPMMPMPGNPQMAMNPSLMPGMRPPISLPRPMPGYPGMPQMVTPPGAPSMPGQMNPSSMGGQVNNGVPRPMTMSAPMMVPGAPTSGAPPPMFTPSMYQASPTQPQPQPPSAAGGFETSNANNNAQSQDADH